VAAKVDWLARGLPREGDKAGERRAIDDVVTAGPALKTAVVTTPEGVLLGVVRRADL
jgi:hypothetical protein